MARETHQPYYDISAPAAIAERNKRRYFRTKRLMDIVLSFVLLMLLSPLLLLIALLIKLDSPGPVIFAQERMSYDWRSRKQRRFILYKFRSMYHSCDQSVHQKHAKDWIRGQKRAKGSSDHAKLVKLTNDRRVTRVGRILRKTSLDELPQLWNVLKGEMSLVGPRPPLVYEVAEYEPRHYGRLETIPGCTGLWQVGGWYTLGFEEMVELDMWYIEHQSLWLDIKILLQTVPAVLSVEGRG